MTAPSPAFEPATAAPGLGLDVGGTATRWVLAGPDGRPVAQGQAAGWTALDLQHAAGRATVAEVLGAVAAQVAAQVAGAAAPQRVVAGVTGFDAGQRAVLQPLLAEGLGVPVAGVQLCNDIELACRGAFAPGAGLVVCAGTGSVAALLDADGTLQRAGGRGVLIDDAGGGHWIACRALRAVWRAEDAAPGAWQGSPLARALFEAIGGPDWAQTRQRVYGASRGEVGRLALAVAQAAPDDPQAMALLRQAGVELARLALALQQRHGPQPVALAGRVFDLHPVVESALRCALPAGTPVTRLRRSPAQAAAAWAAAGRPVPLLAPN